MKDIHNKESLDRYFKETDNFEYLEDWEVDEVLAPVPSYEEWQQLKEYKRIVTSYNMKPIDYDIACETVNKLLEQVVKLKELLKECKGLFNRSTVDGEEPTNGELIMILTKIEEILK